MHRCSYGPLSFAIHELEGAPDTAHSLAVLILELHRRYRLQNYTKRADVLRRNSIGILITRASAASADWPGPACAHQGHHGVVLCDLGGGDSKDLPGTGIYEPRIHA